MVMRGKKYLFGSLILVQVKYNILKYNILSIIELLI